jgi:hypothetical protein
MEYLDFTSPSNPYIWFMFWLSWLPRAMKKCSGYSSLNPNRVKMHSTENEPLSTKSPLKSYGKRVKLKAEGILKVAIPYEWISG